MIISASRRTDIPAFYAEWFINRLKEGFVLVENPLNKRQVSKIPLDPEKIEGIMFWTKNVTPLLEFAPLLKNYPCAFQYTITAYGPDWEPGLANKEKVIIPSLAKLAQKFAPHCITWRYDPIIITPELSVDYHLKHFASLCSQLEGQVSRCIISFVDVYKKIANLFSRREAQTPDPQAKEELVLGLMAIAEKYHLPLTACAEEGLEKYHLGPASCINKEIFEKLSGHKIELKKDKNQRSLCTCCQSIDIGAYNTCYHNCLYCYANNAHPKTSLENMDMQSPIFPGTTIHPQAIIKERTI